MRYRPIVLALLLSVLPGLAGCKKKGQGTPVLAIVFAGPVSVNLRQELTPGSKPVASVKHGEQLDVIQVRRRFVRVRTNAGAEGWTDARNLLTPEQMEDLQELAKHAAKLPSQGDGAVYDTLNMHAEPSRQSTSFYQITEGMRVEVVDHDLVEKARNPLPPATLNIQKPVRPRARKAAKTSKIPPPPRGSAPALPPNWLDLSKTELTEEEKRAEELERHRAPKPVMEDWNLVRTKDRSKAGWVLARNLRMAIPDEVAQYSEGARITSYFSLATVQDGDQTKNHWLWTTIRDGGEEYEFDSFRVFIWNVRRHRYETAYIERKVQGYYPSSVKQGRPATFSLILRDEAGALYQKNFAFEGYMVRKVGEAPVQPQ